MATLFIHIGMPKAGSTSIQRALFTSRPILAKHGVGHLSLAASHDRILLALFREVGINSSLHGVTYLELGLDRTETAVDIGLLKQRLDEELAANTMKKFIVTGERLHRFDGSTPVRREHAAHSRLFQEILRRHPDHRLCPRARELGDQPDAALGRHGKELAPEHL
jgi:hypothetical protein